MFSNAVAIRSRLSITLVITSVVRSDSVTVFLVSACVVLFIRKTALTHLAKDRQHSRNGVCHKVKAV